MKKQINEIKQLQKIAGILNEDINPTNAKILVLDPDDDVMMYNSLDDFMDDSGNDGAEIDIENPISTETVKSYGVRFDKPNPKWNRLVDKFAGHKFYEVLETFDEGTVIAVI